MSDCTYIHVIEWIGLGGFFFSLGVSVLYLCILDDFLYLS